MIVSSWPCQAAVTWSGTPRERMCVTLVCVTLVCRVPCAVCRVPCAVCRVPCAVRRAASEAKRRPRRTAASTCRTTVPAGASARARRRRRNRPAPGRTRRRPPDGPVSVAARPGRPGAPVRCDCPERSSGRSDRPAHRIGRECASLDHFDGAGYAADLRLGARLIDSTGRVLCERVKPPLRSSSVATRSVLGR